MISPCSCHLIANLLVQPILRVQLTPERLCSFAPFIVHVPCSPTQSGTMARAWHRLSVAVRIANGFRPEILNAGHGGSLSPEHGVDGTDGCTPTRAATSARACPRNVATKLNRTVEDYVQQRHSSARDGLAVIGLYPQSPPTDQHACAD